MYPNTNTLFRLNIDVNVHCTLGHIITALSGSLCFKLGLIADMLGNEPNLLENITVMYEQK